MPTPPSAPATPAFNAEQAETLQAAHPGAVSTEQVQAALRAALDEVARLTEAARPLACDMKHQEPFDFAWCHTHDTTFALRDTCKYNGRDPFDVADQEAREQRGRAVRAEMALEEHEAALADGGFVIKVPVVPFPGGQTQAGFYRGAADRIEGGYAPGGSNVTAAVLALLRCVADAVEAKQAAAAPSAVERH